MWGILINLAISYVLSIATAPKPTTPKAAALSDFEAPVAEEGRPIPVIFGTVRLTGPNVVWYGDLGTSPIKSDGGKK